VSTQQQSSLQERTPITIALNKIKLCQTLFTVDIKIHTVNRTKGLQPVIIAIQYFNKTQFSNKIPKKNSEVLEQTI